MEKSPPEPNVGAAILNRFRQCACLLALAGGTALAQDPSVPPPAPATSGAAPARTNTVPFEATVRRESVEGIQAPLRVFIKSDRHHFTFLVPEGFRLAGDKTDARITLSHPAARSTVVVTLTQLARPAKPEEFNHLFLQTVVELAFPGAEEQARGDVTADGVRGPSFDLLIKTPSGLPLFTRVAHIAFPEGVVRLELRCDPKDIDTARFDLNSVLITFKRARDGKLDFPSISNKL